MMEGIRAERYRFVLKITLAIVSYFFYRATLEPKADNAVACQYFYPSIVSYVPGQY